MNWNYQGEGGGGGVGSHTKELSQKGYGYFLENAFYTYNLLVLKTRMFYIVKIAKYTKALSWHTTMEKYSCIFIVKSMVYANPERNWGE